MRSIIALVFSMLLTPVFAQDTAPAPAAKPKLVAQPTANPTLELKQVVLAKLSADKKMVMINCTKCKTERRTRLVDVQKTRLETRTRKDEAGQDVEYTVEVPYKEQMEVEYVVCLPPEGYRADKPFDQVGVYNLRGEMLDRDEAANRLLKAQQVFAIECKPGMNTIVLDPFYAQLLPPDMLVLYCKNLAETVPAPPKAVPPKPVPTAKK